MYEFDEHMNYINNYTLMDLDSHAIKRKYPEINYNNILMDKYKIGDVDPLRNKLGVKYAR